MTKPCAYPGCNEQFTPTNNRQRYHDRRESWRLSNRRWSEANKQKKASINHAYYLTANGFMARRGHELRALRERTEERLAALEREEQECRMLLESLTRMR